jgi:hypothetical protein
LVALSWTEIKLSGPVSFRVLSPDPLSGNLVTKIISWFLVNLERISSIFSI